MSENVFVKKSWFYRNWKWVTPVGVLLCILIFGIYLLGDIINGFGTALADPGLIDKATARAQTHPEVQTYFGNNIQTGTLLEGEVVLAEDGKSINAHVPLRGDKGSGVMDIYAHLVDQKWVHDSVHVRLKKPEKRTIVLPIVPAP